MWMTLPGWSPLCYLNWCILQRGQSNNQIVALRLRLLLLLQFLLLSLCPIIVIAIVSMLSLGSTLCVEPCCAVGLFQDICWAKTWPVSRSAAARALEMLATDVGTWHAWPVAGLKGPHHQWWQWSLKFLEYVGSNWLKFLLDFGWRLAKMGEDSKGGLNNEMDHRGFKETSFSPLRP